MKTKIIVIKILTAIIAISAAITAARANSTLVVTSVYVYYTTATNGIIRQYCTLCGECDHPGSFICLARVQIGSQAPVNYNAKLIFCETAATDIDSGTDCVKNLPITAALIP